MNELYAAPEMELLETGEALCRRKEMGICGSEPTILRRETQRGARLRPVGPSGR